MDTEEMIEESQLENTNNEELETTEAEQDPIEIFKSRLAELEAERDQLRDQLLRTLADAQNARKRFDNERQQLQKYAAEGIIRDLLPVLDNFQRAISAIENGGDLDGLLEGVKMIDKQIRGVLESKGVKPVKSVGEKFDPEMHEAIGTDPASEEFEPETVTVELEAGYWLGDRVIRPARVRVAR
jgi:molecular chaperone GrpE